MINVTSGCICRAEALTEEVMGPSMALATAAALERPEARSRTRRESRMVPIPMVIAHFGHFGLAGKKVAIVFDGFAAESLQAGAGGEAGSRLVEADVAVAADAKNLQVDAAGRFDGLFVFGAVGVVVAAERCHRECEYSGEAD